jgi:hypothetical protein
MTDPMIPPVEPGSTGPIARQFREILIWPVQLMPLPGGGAIQNHWEKLGGDNCAWTELTDEFTADCQDFKERHYVEFVAFMPHVQRFLYGEGTTDPKRAGYGASPIKVYRRKDVAQARVQGRADGPVLGFEIAHVDLYFFYDIDVAFLVVELFADELPLAEVQDVLFRFGRAYPTSWNPDGSAVYCCHKIEWLGHDGTVLAASDYERRAQYMEFVCTNKAPYIAAHWAFLLRPMVLHHSGEAGAIRYRQLEYQRMPLLAYLAIDDPASLSRSDWMRIGLASPPGPPGQLPYSRRFMADFEARFCYDRFWDELGGHDGTPLRIICSRHSVAMVGSVADPHYIDAEVGALSLFRHQYFLIGLIAHLHRAALLMFSDRLVTAISDLDVSDVDSIKRFKRDIRRIRENFLRFTHRYWFHEVSNQLAAADLFRRTSDHLDTDRLFEEVRAEVEDMSNYLDSDSQRRQSNSVLRLTVVTIFGLIGTLATGFLGMNLIAAADEPVWLQAFYFLIVFLPTVWLILYTIMKSRKLSDFLESLSDERLPIRHKFAGLRKKNEKAG